jgi:hypothetical protein
MEYLSKEYYRAGATYLSPEVLEEIRNSRGKVKNAVTVMAKKHHISTRRVYEIWRRSAIRQPDHFQQGGSDNQSLSNPNITFLPQNNVLEDASLGCNTIPNSKKKKTEGKKRSQEGQAMPETKKEIISPTESSEDVLDFYKRTDNTLEKIKARGHLLISK